MDVRVRYAPSPTGLQHIGGVRTALFNYLFARANGGRFILRVEDTDRERFSEEALEDLYDTLGWLGIKWDEGPDIGGEYAPYVQSARVEMYREYAEKLIQKGDAYYCFCTPERLDGLRKKQRKEKLSIGYDRHCSGLSMDEALSLRKGGKRCVVRFRVPENGETAFYDEILGEIVRENREINPDPVILKPDGFPTYHLANVVDDHFMEISHILRAQEWIPSGALHVLLYNSFGWKVPKYCHLPMVMGKDGQKLSKRHGSTSVRDFRASGYLPEALINYIALLGWSFDDSREFFTLRELEGVFDLKKINKARGVFDYRKLEWFNGQYIRKMENSCLKEGIIPILERDGVVGSPPSDEEMCVIDGMIPLIKERLHFLSDVSEMSEFLFRDNLEYPKEDLVSRKVDEAKTIEILKAAGEIVKGFVSRTDEENEDIFRKTAEDLGVKLGSLLMPLRVAITGKSVSPPLFGSFRLLGEERVLKRINQAIALFQ